MPPVREPQSVVARVTAELEGLALRWRATPGHRLPSERALAAQLNVSRSMVREGVQRLVARGVLQSRPGSGVFIAPSGAQYGLSVWAGMQTRSDRAELFEVRKMIECSAARLAAERASVQDRAALADVLQRMDAAVDASDVEEEARADSEFHALLVVAAKNSVLTKLYAGLDQAIRRHISSNTFEARQGRTDALELAASRLAQHHAIYQSVLRQQGQHAYAAASAHLDFVQQQFNLPALAATLVSAGVGLRSRWRSSGCRPSAPHRRLVLRTASHPMADHRAPTAAAMC